MASKMIAAVVVATACGTGSAFSAPGVRAALRGVPAARGGAASLAEEEGTFAGGSAPTGARAAAAAAAAVLAAATAMRARRPVVGGNWKCNPEKAADLDG